MAALPSVRVKVLQAGDAPRVGHPLCVATSTAWGQRFCGTLALYRTIHKLPALYLPVPCCDYVALPASDEFFHSAILAITRPAQQAVVEMGSPPLAFQLSSKDAESIG